MIAKRKCPLCHNEDVDLIHSLHYIYNRTINDLPENIDFVLCKKCSLVYNDMFSSQKEFDNYYKNNSLYDYSYTRTNIIEHYNCLDKTVQILSKYINQDSSILDIACGAGYLLSKLYDKGYNNLHGIDVSNAINSNRYKDKIDYINGNIFDVNNLFNKKFDLIILSDVIEHIFNLKILIKNVIDCLNENGIVYIKTPYIPYYKERHCLSIEHINHFSKRAFTYLALEYNLEIMEFGDSYFDKEKEIYVILKKIDFDSNQKIIYDFKKFINESYNNINYELINELEKSQKKVILWGIGLSILPILPKLKKLNIVHIVDTASKKHGKIIFNNKIINPDDITDKEAIILILPDLYYEGILNQVQELNLKNDIAFLQNRTEQNRTEQNTVRIAA
ncbi:class I SAM-dependent methyltransferase [Brachyspira hyodysenteriae]|uniref:class I SAM-dependent methyltransferase n=1 Tax=Brachyspira hyodysenteriae TaxID=159 RepID=UPI0022CD76B5|nr:class I SAM-dependent methyltransferase [Brachyspira hyodysenteriae]MCZ9840556.1 class I SAM-dependent methyltransferase [Brachyspira hyodysenteriae]